MNFATDIVASLHRYAQPWSAQNRSKATRLPHAIMESYSGYPRALPRLLLQPQVGLFPCCLWRDASGPGFTHQTYLSLRLGLRAALRSGLLLGQAGFGSRI